MTRSWLCATPALGQSALLRCALHDDITELAQAGWSAAHRIFAAGVVTSSVQAGDRNV